MAEQSAFNIDLSAIRKKRFTINNDESKVLELNTSDMGIISRLETAQSKLLELDANFTELQLGEDMSLSEYSMAVDKLDATMRSVIDSIFDANVCELCAPFGTMFDPIDGELRYEHIINVLVTLYEENLAKEVKRIQAKMKKHTNKYTG